jgi:hypothetical protein
MRQARDHATGGISGGGLSAALSPPDEAAPLETGPERTFAIDPLGAFSLHRLPALCANMRETPAPLDISVEGEEVGTCGTDPVEEHCRGDHRCGGTAAELRRA